MFSKEEEEGEENPDEVGWMRRPVVVSYRRRRLSEPATYRNRSSGVVASP